MARLIPYAPQRQPRPLGGVAGIQLAEDFDAEDPRIEALFGGVE